MCLEDAGLKEIEALKAQVNELLRACKLYGDSLSANYPELDCKDAIEEADTIVLMTPEQCLNQIKADTIDEFVKLAKELRGKSC